ncbi:reverse transcriptase [Gossypium australe]|uniref:Reverse transcriptase n=1 Tax=Gossypium australe TaxID=47621 RepID=A0A5B6UZJ9_9ROSI|nr:reverse transcriptase [Gossypium australe]
MEWESGDLRAFMESQLNNTERNRERDFNEILFSFEKQGRRTREERQMEAFRRALEDCELADLGFSWQWYTWERGRLASNNIRERLDRGVANPKWWDLFKNFEVNHLQHSFSDHCPLVVSTNTNDGRYNSGHSRWFRFNADWILSPTCEEHIKNIWLSSSQDVLVKLQELGRSLQGWAKSEKKSRTQHTTELNGRLRDLGECDISEDILEEITEIKIDLNLEADKEEIYWEQKARTNWLKMGDKNTAFFHNSASQRRRKNEVKGLEDEFGTLRTETMEMEEMATNYFKELFSSKGISDCSRLMDYFQPNIMEGHNRELMAEFTSDEVVLAIKSIGPLKAPGWFSCNLLSEILAYCWGEITKYCLDVLKGERNIEEVNFTSIVLIPKVSSPKQMNQFRPISLCSVIYKIISKILKNTQGAFILGRQITDNIFVAYEILHSFKKKRGAAKKGFALKLDMSKAYDRIE